MRISKPRISKSSVLTHLTPAFFLKYKYKMSSGTNAHPARAGFNQSGGAYFMIMQPLTVDSGGGVSAVTPALSYNTANITSHMSRLASAGSNSGGAFIGPTLVVANARDAFGIDAGSPTVGAASAGALADVAAGKLLKDMGKTIVSAGRTFRKFAAVGTGNPRYSSSFGVVGGAGASPNGGYATFYLEVGREGNPGSGTANNGVPAPIARYF